MLNFGTEYSLWWSFRHLAAEKEEAKQNLGCGVVHERSRLWGRLVLELHFSLTKATGLVYKYDDVPQVSSQQ